MMCLAAGCYEPRFDIGGRGHCRGSNVAIDHHGSVRPKGDHLRHHTDPWLRSLFVEQIGICALLDLRICISVKQQRLPIVRLAQAACSSADVAV